MTTEEAIKILDPETRRETLKLVPVHERISADQEACRLAVAALRAQQENLSKVSQGFSQDQVNAPLTLDELRRMDGEPVWIRVAGGVWGLVDGFDSIVRLVRGGIIDLSRIAEISYRHKAQGTTITCTATGQPCIMCQMGPCGSRKEVTP